MLIDLLQYCLSPSIFTKILVVDCTVPDGADAILSCANDTLLVNWPTNQTYPASVTEIPSALKRTLNDRLAMESKYPILNLVAATKSPP